MAGGSADPHFLLVEVDAEKVTVTARDAQGSKFDQAVLRKAGGEAPPEKGVSAQALEAFLAFWHVAEPHLGQAPAGPWKEAFSARVVNPYRSAIGGEVRWEVAEGSGWTIEPAVIKVAVPPLEARSYSFTLTRQAGAAGPPPVFSFVAGDEELRVRRGPFRVQEPQ